MPDTQANHPHRPFNPDEWHDDQGELESRKAQQKQAQEETAEFIKGNESKIKRAEREARKEAEPATPSHRAGGDG